MSITPARRERRRTRVPLLLVAAGAWAFLAITPMPMAGQGAPVPTGSPMTGPLMDDRSTMSHDIVMSSSNLWGPASIVSFVLGTTAMVVAMMWPLLGAPLDHVRARSLARRRAMAMVTFLVPYTLVWVVVATPLTTLAAALATESGERLVVVAVVVAVVWQLSPAKQRCLNRLHRHVELPAFGPAAVTGVLRFGTTHALSCVGSCWALMLLPLFVAADQVPAMLVTTLWLAIERLAPPRRPAWGTHGLTKQVRTVLARTRRALRQQRPTLLPTQVDIVPSTGPVTESVYRIGRAMHGRSVQQSE